MSEPTDAMVEAAALTYLGLPPGWGDESIPYIKVQRERFREALRVALDLADTTEMEETPNDIRDRVLRGCARYCNTHEGGSCDCGFHEWLFEQAELRARLLETAMMPSALKPSPFV